MADSVASQVRSGLQNQGLPTPKLSWIQSVVPSRTPMPPLPALIAAARARLMTVDITDAQVLDLANAASLPTNVSDQKVKETKLPRDVLVQVLDIDNLTKSKWEQIEELEAIARGEQTRGREIIRLPTTTQDEEDGVSSAPTQVISTAPGSGNNRNGLAATPKNSTHRLVVQDCKGQKVYALELKRLEKIGIGSMNVGEKVLLKKGTVVARGTILLEPALCAVLGGKVEAWQKPWIDGRLARLRDVIG